MSTFTVEVDPVVSEKIITSVELFLQYEFFAEDTTIFVYLKDADGSTVRTLQVYIEPEVYVQWTIDDQYIVDYVLKELQFTAKKV